MTALVLFYNERKRECRDCGQFFAETQMQRTAEGDWLCPTCAERDEEVATKAGVDLLSAITAEGGKE